VSKLINIYLAKFTSQICLTLDNLAMDSAKEVNFWEIMDPNISHDSIHSLVLSFLSVKLSSKPKEKKEKKTCGCSVTIFTPATLKTKRGQSSSHL
jgi:hypothetical protein